MVRRLAPLLPALIGVALGAAAAGAAVTKCVDRAGRITFTNVGCPEGYRAGGASAPAQPASAVPPTAQAAAATSPRPPAASFLWAVAGRRNTVHLLGSLHLAPADLYPLGDAIEGAYRASTVVVFEADPAAPADSGRDALLAAGIYRDGSTIGAHLPAPTLDLLRRRAAEAGLVPATLEPFKPWLCALLVTEATLRRGGIDPAAGIDRHLLSRSLADGKRRLFLETPSFQLDLLAGLDESMQGPFLEKALEDLDQLRDLYGQVARHWRTGDAEALGALFEPAARRFPEIHRRFVLERNDAWLPAIRRLLEAEENALVVVGAGHLTGARGLLALLRTGGFRVEQR